MEKELKQVQAIFPYAIIVCNLIDVIICNDCIYIINNFSDKYQIINEKRMLGKDTKDFTKILTVLKALKSLED